MEYISKIFGAFIEPTVVVFILIALLFINSWFFKVIKKTSEDITRGLISFLLVLVGAIAFILVLPIEKELKGQVIGFLGIILSAGIALSSTTVLGNLIAGIMNNSMKRFRNGDLIKIGDFHGRVIKKSMFHTEIQLQDSNFITIPNLYIANNPVKLTRKTNTVVSTSVSLGYEISRVKVEKALIEAATIVGLKDPYVYIINLGDFSVTYKIHGFLEDSSKFFSAKSLLNAEVMDKLHEEKIEIVSPNFMNQRRVDDEKFLPKQEVKETKQISGNLPEDKVFDEAIESEKIEIKKDRLKDIDKKQEELKKQLDNSENDKDKKRIELLIQRNEEMKKRLKEQIVKDEESLS